MHNPEQTFKNIREMLKLDIGHDFPSKENKLPNWLTICINLVISASLLVGTIYVIKLLF